MLLSTASKNEDEFPYQRRDLAVVHNFPYESLHARARGRVHTDDANEFQALWFTVGQRSTFGNGWFYKVSVCVCVCCERKREREKKNKENRTQQNGVGGGISRNNVVNETA